jgi:hypothetical protein
MLRFIACIGFIVCISAVIPASFNSTPSNAMAFPHPGPFLCCLPQVTQLVAVYHFLSTAMPHLTVTSKFWVPRHFSIDVAADRVDSDASAAPSSSTNHMNLSCATGGKSLVNPSDPAAVGTALATLLSSNIQFLASMNRIYMFLLPSCSSVLVSAAVASFDSGSNNAVFGAPPLPLQWFECANVNTRILRPLFSGRQGSTNLQLHRAPIISKSLPLSMHPTSALCNTPTTLLASLRNALVSASPQMMFHMTGSTCAFLFFALYIYPSYLRQLNRTLLFKVHRVLLWALSFSSVAL